MPHLLVRLLARQADIDAIAAAVSGVHGVRRIAQADDLAPQMGRHSPATQRRPADAQPTLHSLEIELAEGASMEAVREVAETVARQRGIGAEWIST